VQVLRPARRVGVQGRASQPNTQGVFRFGRLQRADWKSQRVLALQWNHLCGAEYDADDLKRYGMRLARCEAIFQMSTLLLASSGE